MYIINEANNLKSDLKVIINTIKWWNYKYTKNESDKSFVFRFKTTPEADNVFKDLKSSRLFKDSWRLDIQENELFYDIR